MSHGRIFPAAIHAGFKRRIIARFGALSTITYSNSPSPSRQHGKFLRSIEESRSATCRNETKQNQKSLKKCEDRFLSFLSSFYASHTPTTSSSRRHILSYLHLSRWPTRRSTNPTPSLPVLTSLSHQPRKPYPPINGNDHFHGQLPTNHTSSPTPSTTACPSLPIRTFVRNTLHSPHNPSLTLNPPISTHIDSLMDCSPLNRRDLPPPLPHLPNQVHRTKTSLL